jgi:2-iminobutanoate/2-iminopropanoate deaminase
MRSATLASLGAFLVVTGCSSPRVDHQPAKGALGPYSGAVSAGSLCFVSGKVGTQRESFGAEASSAIDAVEAELARAGLGLSDVVSVTVYLSDLALYPELNAVYAKRFPEPWPARACVAVSALPGQARVELQAVASRH